VVLRGDLDLGAVKTFERDEAGDRAGGPITIDASGLIFIDSTGIRLFVHTEHRLESSGCLILHGLKARVRRVFDMTCVPDGIGNIYIVEHERATVQVSSRTTE
jgi:anti-anti-sigma factor